MATPTLPDSPIYGETAVQPPSHQDSEPLTRSDRLLSDARRQRHQGTTVLVFLVVTALGVAVLNEDAIVRVGCTLVFQRAAAALIQREERKAGDP